jgi:diaminopimelate epimerase
LLFEVLYPPATFLGMVVDFTKMDGAGNDFVMIDGRAQTIRLDGAQAARLCDRHRGVGADGVIVLKPCASGRAEWAWDFYNSDGSMAEMCGNGARCFGRFVQRLTGENSFTLEALAGLVTIRCQDEMVTIQLTPLRNLRLGQMLPLRDGSAAVHSLDTGVPHAVLFVEDAAKSKVQEQGAEIRYHAHFAPRGTNVNFVQLLGGNTIRVRTYERGVEGETLACGTGVTASALIAAEAHQLQSPIAVQVEGGKRLEVAFTKRDGQYTDVTLTGPADFVFEGQIEIMDGAKNLQQESAAVAGAAR